MIAAIGHDRMTSAATRSAPTTHGAAGFAATFDALTAPSFALSRSSPARESERAVVANADTERLDAALAAFKKEMSMTPAERVRRDVLKSMDLTDEAIDALPPKERGEVERKVAMEVARRMKVMHGGGTAPATANATNLQDIAVVDRVLQ